VVDPVLELVLDGPGLAAHPEDHPGEDPGGGQGHGGEGAQPGRTREVPEREVHHDADEDGQADGGGHAGPRRAPEVEPVDPAQVGEDDGDDEGGLEALADHDQQRRHHVRRA
jgi:hypothetical protein